MVRAGEQKAHDDDIELVHKSPVRSDARRRRLAGGNLTGQKSALKMKEVWSNRTRLELKRRIRDLALFNPAIESKLRGCDLVSLRMDDAAAGGEVTTRGIIVQKKTDRPVQFEITEQTRTAVSALMRRHSLKTGDFRLQRRLAGSPHLSKRQYARIVQGWVASIGLSPAIYGAHSLRRTKAALIYRKTGNLRGSYCSGTQS